MPTNPKKELGNSGPCYKCGKTMFCGEGYEKKPTWQNEDGKSHYTQDGSCRGSAIIGGEPTPNIAPSIVDEFADFKPQFVSAGESKIWIDVVNKVAEYTILAQKELVEIKNPALKGLITKASFVVLNKIQERQAKK